MFKKELLTIATIITTFIFCSNIEAICYEKCTLSNKCDYVTSCTEVGTVSCVVVEDQLCASSNNDGTYDNYSPSLVSCGEDSKTGKKLLSDIPSLLPKVISILYTLVQIAVPVVLVIFGMLDLVKAVTAGKEDEIKKGQQLLIKRLIAAALVFFVFVIVKVLISLVADSSGSRIIDCVECFIKNECDLQGVQI